MQENSLVITLHTTWTYRESKGGSAEWHRQGTMELENLSRFPTGPGIQIGLRGV